MVSYTILGYLAPLALHVSHLNHYTCHQLHINVFFHHIDISTDLLLHNNTRISCSPAATWITKSGPAMQVEVSIGVHVVFPLSLGIGRDDRCMGAGVKANKAFIEPQTRLIWGEPGSGIAQISDEQRPAVMTDDVTIGAHMVFPLSLGMGRENRWEFMCLQTWNGFMEP